MTQDVCPRHPDQHTGVRCQRCGRPVCAQCQRPAAVGVHCVDCVQESTKAVRRARTVYGGHASTQPLLTYAIIALCAVSFGLQYLIPDFTVRFMFAPIAGVAEPWRFFTSAFLHSTSGTLPLHILFNMYALYIVGTQLEPALGRLRFGLLYLLSAFGGSVAYTVLQPPERWLIGSVGASGAVFGLFGAIFILVRQSGRNASTLIGLIGVNLVIGFMIPSIAWQAHLGGLITGGLLAWGYTRPPVDKRAKISLWITAAMAVLLAIIVAIRYFVAFQLGI